MEAIRDIKILGFWRFMFLRFVYRHLMRFAHKFNWHYAPESLPFEDGSTQLWCQWCGFRMTKKNLKGPLEPLNRGKV